MITYNGIIDYFREFADKHFQIHSFTEGTADKIDLKKILYISLYLNQVKQLILMQR